MDKEKVFQWLIDECSKVKNAKSKFVLKERRPKAFSYIESMLGPYFGARALYDYLQPNAIKNCVGCNVESKFTTFLRGYSRFCGPKCSNADFSVKAEKVKAYTDRYGVSNPSQANSVKRAKIRTSRKNRGTDYPMQSPSVKAKRKLNQLVSSYGEYDHHMKTEENRKRQKELVVKGVSGYGSPGMRKSMLNRYGVENVSQLDWVKSLKRKTCLENWGAPSHMQSAAGFVRSHTASHRTKDFTYRGVQYRLQGYEPLALVYLVEELGIDQEDIRTTSISIPYSELGKHKKYYPDFIIPNGFGNLICVEVKSTYTSGLDSGSISNNLKAKYKGVKRAGYEFLLLVMTPTGELAYSSFNSLINTEIRLGLDASYRGLLL